VIDFPSVAHLYGRAPHKKNYDFIAYAIFLASERPPPPGRGSDCGATAAMSAQDPKQRRRPPQGARLALALLASGPWERRREGTGFTLSPRLLLGSRGVLLYVYSLVAASGERLLGFLCLSVRQAARFPSFSLSFTLSDSVA
jgi:hypothetical protein